MSPTETIALPDAASQAFAARVSELADRLQAALNGTGPAVEVLEGPTKGTFEIATPTDAPAGTAAVIRTSGSTGMPKRTALSASALRANAAALSAGMLGDGHWLLCLPLHYVAGLTVVTRALLADTGPGRGKLAVMDLTRHFDAEGFAELTDLLEDNIDGADRLYTSLVPTQLSRLLDSDSGREALRHYDGTLVGGGRTPDSVKDSAAAHQIGVRYTYGSAETCGGCVHNAVPLPGVTVDTVPGPDGNGSRLRLAGDMVASGYLGDPERTAEHFGTHPDGTRFYVTDDLGKVSETTSGETFIEVHGRIDDVINTGGVKVSAQLVQRLVESHPHVAAALVIGVEDPEWGHVVGLGWEPTEDVGHDAEALRLTEDKLQTDVRDAYGSAARPRVLYSYDALPRLGNEKPDRRRIAADLADRLRTHG